MTRRPRRTPGGALLSVRGGSRWKRIEIERLGMPPAVPAVAEVAHELARAAASWSLRHRAPGGIGIPDGRFIWSALIPAGDLDEALAALLALEHGRLGPARDLTAKYATKESSR